MSKMNEFVYVVVKHSLLRNWEAFSELHEPAQRSKQEHRIKEFVDLATPPIEIRFKKFKNYSEKTGAEYTPTSVLNCLKQCGTVEVSCW